MTRVLVMLRMSLVWLWLGIAVDGLALFIQYEPASVELKSVMPSRDRQTGHI